MFKMSVFDSQHVSDAVNEASETAQFRALECAMRKGLKEAIKTYGWFRDPTDSETIYRLSETEEFMEMFPEEKVGLCPGKEIAQPVGVA